MRFYFENWQVWTAPGWYIDDVLIRGAQERRITFLDAAQDSGGDGASNSDEAASGTDPLDSDTDDDRIPDDADPCPLEHLNDADGDSLCASVDNCPDVANSDQSDGDGDGPGDVCDVCPLIYDPGQEDRDSDRVGDVCDPYPDLALVEMSPYDLTRGRIVYRHKKYSEVPEAELE